MSFSYIVLVRERSRNHKTTTRSNKHMALNVTKSKVARFVVATVAVGVVAMSSASPVSAAKIGDSCKQ